MTSPENNDAGFAVLSHKVDSIHINVGQIQNALNELTNAIIKLALIEERQIHFGTAQERIFRLVERLEQRMDTSDARIATLEIAEPEQRRTSGWVTTAVWTCAGLLGLILLKKLGIPL